MCWHNDATRSQRRMSFDTVWREEFTTFFSFITSFNENPMFCQSVHLICWLFMLFMLHNVCDPCVMRLHVICLHLTVYVFWEKLFYVDFPRRRRRKFRPERNPLLTLKLLHIHNMHVQFKNRKNSCFARSHAERQRVEVKEEVFRCFAETTIWNYSNAVAGIVIHLI